MWEPILQQCFFNSVGPISGKEEDFLCGTQLAGQECATPKLWSILGLLKGCIDGG